VEGAIEKGRKLESRQHFESFAEGESKKRFTGSNSRRLFEDDIKV